MKAGTANRIFGLDGLRFFSFVFVIYNHFYTVLDSYGLHFAEPAWIDALGHYGLQYFFAGSGFLISFMVMKEYEKTGRFRIGHFYLRRILRIWPVYFVLVGIVYLFIYPNNFFYLQGMSAEFEPYKLMALWLFLLVLPHVNEFVYPTAPYLHHTYTIGIEEQFYLVWALLFRFLRRYFFSCLNILLISGILLNLCHYFLFDALNRSGLSIINKIATYYDYSQVNTFCIGSYLAIYYRSGHQSLKWFRDKWVQVIFYLLFAVLVITNARLPFLTNEAMSIVVCFILLFATFKNTSLINYSLPLWEFLGKISYSVYLFHYIALVIVLRLIIFNLGLNMNKAGIFILAIAGVLLVAILFGLIGYYTVERWCIRLKNKFSATKKSADSTLSERN